MRVLLPAAAGLVLLPSAALAAGLNGAALGPAWTLPFIGVLLSIAILPHLAPRFWDHRLGALCVFWAALALIPLAATQGVAPVLGAVLHLALAEYLPFVLLLLALYTIAGGLVVGGTLRGRPALNTGILAFGTALASLIGTTGASMVLIRPLLRANDGRRHSVHVVVFFIFLVSNVGGALSPLGDPPLFLGFLRGVEFFWPTRALAAPTAFVAGILLGLFFALDSLLYARDAARPPLADPTPESRLHWRGTVNLLLLALAVGAIVLSGVWRPGVALSVAGVDLQGQNLVRDGGLILLTLASLLLTPRSNRIANDFSWRPIVEVATLFAAIFVCIVPVSAALAAGRAGVFAPLLAAVSRPDGTPDPVAYFWLTGLLSSFLDNAPTYLVFFDLAGGDAGRLTGPLSTTLAAISMGAVFMGANTYIGNAPNFMVYAIAKSAGIRMPGFAGYMLWSGAILLPVFGLVTLVFLL